MDQKIEFKVGIFIIATTLLIIATVGYVIYKKDIFAKEYTYILKSETGGNITQGTPVLFKGFEIGKVSATKLREDDYAVLVEIKIPEKNIDVLRAESTFQLDTPFLGSPRIIVKTPNLNAEPLSQEVPKSISYEGNIDELIKSGRSIAEKVDILMDSLEVAIDNVTKNTEELHAFQKNLSQSMENIEKLTTQYSEKESIAELLTGSKESSENLLKFTRTLRDVDETFKKFDSIAEKADGDIFGKDGKEGVIPRLMDIIDSLKDISKIVNNLNKISGEATQATEELPALRNKLDAAINEIRILVNDLDQLITFGDDPGIELP